VVFAASISRGSVILLLDGVKDYGKKTTPIKTINIDPPGNENKY